jgi:hypothetical protein
VEASSGVVRAFAVGGAQKGPGVLEFLSLLFLLSLLFVIQIILLPPIKLPIFVIYLWSAKKLQMRNGLS